MITVACVWVQANVPFTVEYVTRLRSMVARHLLRPHRFVCLTDKTATVRAQGIEAIYIEPLVRDAGWWSKLELFNPKLAPALAGPVLALDLDVLVVRDLAPFVDFEHSGLALCSPGGTFKGRGAKRTIWRYNSSVMRFDVGERAPAWLRGAYTRWRPDVANRLFGDQDWLGEIFQEQPTFPSEWCPRLSELRPSQNGITIPDEAKVVLVKKPKNHVAAEQWPWFAAQWM